MKSLPVITDPTYDPAIAYSKLDTFFISLLRDKRDLPFVYLTIKILFFLLPIGVLLFMPFITGWLWWILAISYTVLNNFVFKGPFGLMFHCTSHRIWFRKKYNALNYLLPWIVGPFFGQTPETYFSHHIGMHHAENNLEDDDSSTMKYRRDSFIDFLKYFFTFLFLGLIGMSKYFVRKNRKKLLYRSLIGEMSFFIMCAGLMVVDWKATIVVFVLPFLIFRFIAMLGNWTQHAFIDPLDPGNEYKNSITCINTKYNHKCWNDGYHISHHEKPAMHWSEHPTYFLQTLNKYKENNSVVFSNIHFLHVFLYLMFNKYDLLAKNYVNISGHFRTDLEVAQHLRGLVNPIIQRPELNPAN